LPTRRSAILSTTRGPTCIMLTFCTDFKSDINAACLPSAAYLHCQQPQLLSAVADRPARRSNTVYVLRQMSWRQMCCYQCVGQARKVHETTTLLLVALPNIRRYLKKITRTLSNKTYIIWFLITTPHLKCVTTLPCYLSLMACF